MSVRVGLDHDEKDDAADFDFSLLPRVAELKFRKTGVTNCPPK